MHSARLLLQLLRPQRRRVALLLVSVLAGTLIAVGLLPLAVALLFKLLGGEAVALRWPLAGVPALQTWAARLNATFQGPEAVRLRALALVSVLLVVVALLRGGTEYGRTYLGQYIGGRVLVDLRTRLFTRLQRLSLSFYESQRVGDLMSRLTNDVGMVQQLVTEDMTTYFMAPLVVVGGLAVMCYTSWKLTVLVVIFAPLVSWVVSRSGRRIRRLTLSQQQRIGDLNARLHERLAAMRIIQSFARESFEADNFLRLNERTFDAAIKVARVRSLAPQLVQFIATVSLAAVTAFAGMLILGGGAGKFDVADLVSYYVVTQQVGIYVVKFGALHLRVQQSLAALGRVMEVMAQEPDIREQPGAAPLGPVAGAIAFRGVSFRYAQGETVLQEINLGIQPGEVVALVGPSGAGKTSVANLVMRLYDPTEGRIEIDGTDIRTVTLDSLRSQIGLVPQETVLFGGTVRDNILYGRVEATEAEVVAAAQAANAHDFIIALPDGYDTDVGEHAVKLSGGQRQRIAVARALLKDPRILILDEATSSLDAESEALVQEALEGLMVGRTTLVIAHRLSTIRKANRILVLSGGRIEEQGSHQELLALGGAYSRLYGLQQPGIDDRESVIG
jgi:subfamily B ATP-binding cassette protein MsbA